MLSTDQMALLEKSMYGVARESYKAVPLTFPKIFHVKKDGITGGGDKNTQLLGADRLRKKEAENRSFNFRSPVQGWQTFVKYHTYYDAVEFSKEAVEDNVKANKIGHTLNGYADTWGDAYRVTQEEETAKIFNKGGLLAGHEIYNGSWGDQVDPSGDLLYDGKPLFNLTGNARYMKYSATTGYYNGVTTSTLSASTFKTLYNLVAVSNKYTELGVPMVNKPNCLLTQDDLMFDAEVLLESAGLPAKAGFLQAYESNGHQVNDKNPFNGKVEHIDWAYLEGGAWYVGIKQAKELCFEERQKPVIEFFRDQSNKMYKATIDARFGIHLKAGVWKKWARNGGTYA